VFPHVAHVPIFNIFYVAQHLGVHYVAACHWPLGFPFLVVGAKWHVQLTIACHMADTHWPSFGLFSFICFVCVAGAIHPCLPRDELAAFYLLSFSIFFLKKIGAA
jgi:hypothetical protein